MTSTAAALPYAICYIAAGVVIATAAAINRGFPRNVKGGVGFSLFVLAWPVMVFIVPEQFFSRQYRIDRQTTAVLKENLAPLFYSEGSLLTPEEREHLEHLCAGGSDRITYFSNRADLNDILGCIGKTEYRQRPTFQSHCPFSIDAASR